MSRLLHNHKIAANPIMYLDIVNKIYMIRMYKMIWEMEITGH